MTLKAENISSSFSNYLSKYQPIVLEKIRELTKQYFGVETSFSDDISSKLIEEVDLSNKIYQKLNKTYFRNIKEMDDAIKKEYYITQLQAHLGNIAQTARIAGISREHLQRKIKQYGINPQNYRISAYVDKKFERKVFSEDYVNHILREQISRLEDKINPELYSRISNDIDKLAKNLSETLNSTINSEDVYNKKIDTVFREVKSKLLSDLYMRCGFDKNKIAKYLNTSISKIQRMLKKYEVGFDYGKQNKNKITSTLEMNIKKEHTQKELENLKNDKKNFDIRDFLKSLKEIKEPMKCSTSKKEEENKKQIMEALAKHAI